MPQSVCLAARLFSPFWPMSFHFPSDSSKFGILCVEIDHYMHGEQYPQSILSPSEWFVQPQVSLVASHADFFRLNILY